MRLGTKIPAAWNIVCIRFEEREGACHHRRQQILFNRKAQFLLSGELEAALPAEKVEVILIRLACTGRTRHQTVSSWTVQRYPYLLLSRCGAGRGSSKTHVTCWSQSSRPQGRPKSEEHLPCKTPHHADGGALGRRVLTNDS